MKSMSFIKMMVVAGLLLSALAGGGVWYGFAQEKPAGTLRRGRSASPKAAGNELKQLAGKWKVVEVTTTESSTKAADQPEKSTTLEIQGDRFEFTQREGEHSVVSKGKLTLETSKSPKWMDWSVDSISPQLSPIKPGFLGIYKIEAGKLTYCMVMHLNGKSPAGGAASRPEEFAVGVKRVESEIKVIAPRGSSRGAPAHSDSRILFKFERVEE